MLPHCIDLTSSIYNHIYCSSKLYTVYKKLLKAAIVISDDSVVNFDPKRLYRLSYEHTERQRQRQRQG